MQKEAKMLLLTGGLVAVGLVLSFFGTILALDGLVQFEEEINAEEYTVRVELDSQDDSGVFALIVRDGSDDNDIDVTIYDPSGASIASMNINENTGQTIFPSSNAGEYTAVIQNNLDTTLPITVALGSNSGSIAQAVTITGTAVLLMGLFGMAATTIYVFKLKRRG